MSYYQNTQNNPQQNPSVQANSPHNRQVQQAAQPAGQQSFTNWMRPQRQARQPQNKSQTSEQVSIQQQPQQPQQGWQPRSPVNPNGTISTMPIAFNANFQPPQGPNMTVSRTSSNTGGDKKADPLWEQLRTQQAGQAGNVPPEYQAVSQAYQQYLGRPGNIVEWQNWAGKPGFEQAIMNSPEAQNWKSVQQNPMSQTPAPNLPQYNPMQIPDYVSQSLGQYNGIQTPGLYDVFRPESYNYGGQLNEQFNPFGQGTQNAFNQLSNMPMGLPVDQLKSAQNELANEMYSQNAGTAMQRAAASGTVDGGMAERNRQLMMDDRNRGLMASHRDIDIQNAMAQRENATALATLGDQLATGRAGRMGMDEDARYRQATEGRAADESYMDFLSNQYNDALSGSEFELDRVNQMSDRGLDAWDTLNNNFFKNRSQNLQDFLGTEGMALDRDSFGETQAQNRFQNIMDLLGFGENQRQFDATYGQNNRKINLSARDSAMQNALQRRGQDINLLDFFKEG